MRAPAKCAPRDWIEWPFFERSHRALAERLDAFIGSPEMDAINHDHVDASCRHLVREMGRAGLLEAAVAPPEADATAIDSRSACLARDTLAWRDGLAHSRCRGWDRGRSRSPARPNFAPLSCRRHGRANGSPPSPCRRRRLGPTWPRWPARRASTAIPT